MGGLGSEKQVKLICKCFSIRAQCFLPFVNILPGARDMFCRISGLSAETRDIPIPSYLNKPSCGVSRRRRWRPKDSRPSVRPCVRTYVRTYVTRLLENCSLLFSETLQLVRTSKCDKNVPNAFLKKSRFAHFGQKLSKIGHLAGCVQL